MATPSLKWDASDVALKVTTASGGVVTMSFPDRATDVSFNMPLTALTNPMTTAGDVIVATTDGVPARVAIGTNGQVLQSDGTTAVWATLSYLTNPMTTAQDIIVGGLSGAATRLAVGTDGQVLSVTSGEVAWVEPSAGFTNPMTTAQDIIVGGAGGAAGRLAVGAEGQVLTVSSGVVAWTNAPTGFTNPMTSEGDIILGGALGAASRLGIGTNGQVLTSNGTTASWSSPSSGFSNPMTTLGDIITADTGGTAKRVGIGTEGQVLKVVSGEPGWANESAGSLGSRSTVSHTTASIDANASEDFTLAVTKMANILKVTADYPCWVRMYGTSAARTADASRLITEDPDTGVGLYGEWASTSGALSVTCSPIPCFQNSDTTPANTAYMTVKNLDSTARAISIGVTFVGLEA